MFTEWLRKVTKGILQPVARFLGKLGISPNAITIFGCLLNICIAVVIAEGHLRLGGILLLPAFLLDAFDGAVAREMNHVTKFGAFLDSCLDRVSESVVYVALAWWFMSIGGREQITLAFLSAIGSMMVSYTRARSEGIGIECKVGYFSRVERGLLMIIGLVSGLVTPLLWVMTIGTTLTAVQRMIYVYQKTRHLSAA
ncbi:MAG: CDP-alcohol phosphatidyltransferase family protein [Chloroflexi bacterium]|nr:CDP-alcohol phosphatidyltransferase family protein [Chloroflexota bacterium]